MLRGDAKHLILIALKVIFRKWMFIFDRKQFILNMFSSEHIESILVTITSETLSSEDWFDTKLQAKFDKSDQNFEQPEEELMDFI